MLRINTFNGFSRPRVNTITREDRFASIDGGYWTTSGTVTATGGNMRFTTHAGYARTPSMNIQKVGTFVQGRFVALTTGGSTLNILQMLWWDETAPGGVGYVGYNWSIDTTGPTSTLRGFSQGNGGGGDVNTYGPTAYNTTTQAYVRVRVSALDATNITFTFEAGPDGFNWTPLGSRTVARSEFTLSAMYLFFRYLVNATPDSADVDNFIHGVVV